MSWTKEARIAQSRRMKEYHAKRRLAAAVSPEAIIDSIKRCIAVAEALKPLSAGERELAMRLAD